MTSPACKSSRRSADGAPVPGAHGHDKAGTADLICMPPNRIRCERGPRAALLALLLPLAAAMPAPAQAVPGPGGTSADKPPARKGAVRVVRDLAYCDGPDADPKKHRLDLFLPAGAEQVPVLMWIHGGGWQMGDRWLFASVGRRFAEAGIGFAAISYRLSPEVRHPAHVQDCAAAFAWLHAHVAEYGGDPARLFVSGQSAGGHLTALLALDPRYLRALAVPAGAIQGAIAMSGVYEIPALPAHTAGMAAMFPAAFGSEPEACRAASPVAHVGNLACPMLVITETEDPGIIRANMRALRTAAEKAGEQGIEFVDAERRNHISIVVRLASPTDEVRQAMVDFVKQRCSALDAQARAGNATAGRR
jgi:acetyl esterase/lipase